MQHAYKFTHNLFQPTYDLQTVDVNGNRFYSIPSGLLLPSVTTVVNYGDKQWLEDWKQALGIEAAAIETKRCGDRGTAVHDMCEKFICNESSSDIIKNHDLNHIKLFNIMKNSIRKRVDNIRLHETVLWSERLGIAGRTDIIADFDGVLSIIDFKTANKPKDESMIQNYFMQCTAYALMAEELYNVPIDNIVIIIGTERGLFPQIFTKNIVQYVKPLLNQIKLFYDNEINTDRL